MSIQGWLLFILIVQIIHGLGTWKLYIKAGRQAWEAFVPIYNAVILLKIINRSTWWTLLLFIPIINLFMFPIIWIETLRTFGKKTTQDMLIGVATLGFYIMFVNYTQEVTYFANRDLKAPSKTMDTLGSLAFAIIVATFVHTYFVQPYVIPTSSLEKSLLVGDFLFVSKFNYGARVPMTTLAAPMVHDTLPLIKVKSYNTFPQLPYYRLPKLQDIERNDIVVFNWPTDTLYHMYKAADKRYDKPIDKKTNYVKRCVAIAGDSLEIKDGIIYINGKESIMPDRAKPQYSYKIAVDGKTQINFEYLIQELDITDGAYQVAPDTIVFSALTSTSAERLKNMPGITQVKRIIHNKTEDGIFPDFKDEKDPINNKWNNDNFGPIYIPEAGKTVALDRKSLPFYKKIINEYEGNKLEVNGDEIRVNGKIATSYTFKQDYYWMMGDNRHNSLDARYFGYTPADHIVGKPIFIWMSWNTNGKGLNKIRWERLFTTVSGTGQPQSYFKYFLILLALYFVGEYFWKKKKNAKENL